jgi:hypothetical protein
MVILIVGNGEKEKKLEEKFALEGCSVIRAEEVVEITKLPADKRKLDMLVLGQTACAQKENRDIISGPDWQEAERLYEKNAVEALCAVQKAFPYLEQGTYKRICYLNAAEGSINASWAREDYGRWMCACAVNMQISILYNRMRPLGYTFRLFGWREEEDMKRQTNAACWYFMGNRSLDGESKKHEDENRLVMRDMDGREVPF